MQLKGSQIQKAAVLYLILWTISPPLGVDMIFRYLALGCVGIWALIAIGRGYFSHGIEKDQFYAIVFAAAVVIIAFMERGTLNGILQQIHIYMLVISFILFSFYKNGYWQELNGIVPIVLIVLAFFNYTTATALQSDPGIARSIVRADEETYQYMRQGIGGYGLIYPQVCVSPAVWVWLKSSFRNNRVCFVVGCIWAFTFVYYLLNAGYAIAVFAAAAGAIMLLVYRRKSVWGAILIAIGLFLAVMASLIYWDAFRELLLDIFDGTKVATKINDLMLTSETGVAEASIQDRIKAYSYSIEAILKYPFIGGLWMASGGGHSAILDTIAKYGVLGGYMYIRLVFAVPNAYKADYRNPKICRICNASIVPIFVIAMLNSMPYDMMCMILLVLPLLYEDIIKWEKLK
ncbi:MAG: hypothetical protein IJF78_02320 [Clostridia bacterium]|nr:hypothetical protein [Clostridia bacterium]